MSVRTIYQSRPWNRLSRAAAARSSAARTMPAGSSSRPRAVRPRRTASGVVAAVAAVADDPHDYITIIKICNLMHYYRCHIIIAMQYIILYNRRVDRNGTCRGTTSSSYLETPAGKSFPPDADSHYTIVRLGSGVRKWLYSFVAHRIVSGSFKIFYRFTSCCVFSSHSWFGYRINSDLNLNRRIIASRAAEAFSTLYRCLSAG